MGQDDPGTETSASRCGQTQAWTGNHAESIGSGASVVVRWVVGKTTAGLSDNHLRRQGSP